MLVKSPPRIMGRPVSRIPAGSDRWLSAAPLIYSVTSRPLIDNAMWDQSPTGMCCLPSSTRSDLPSVDMNTKIEPGPSRVIFRLLSCERSSPSVSRLKCPRAFGLTQRDTEALGVGHGWGKLAVAQPDPASASICSPEPHHLTNGVRL